MIAPNAIEEALGHLGAALIQQSPTDDKIIMDHVRSAYCILQVIAVAQREMAIMPSERRF